MTTLAVIQNHNPQSIAWAGAGALGAMLRTLALILLAGAGLAIVFAAVAVCWVAIVKGLGCLALIALFALATYPGGKHG